MFTRIALLAAVLALSRASFGQVLLTTPNTAKFPTSAVTDTDLYGSDTIMSAQITLSASIDAVVTSFTLSNPYGLWSGLGTSQVITIGDERMTCTSFTSGTSFSGCTRGVAGTVAVAHAAGSVVGRYSGLSPHSQVGAEIKAIEQYLVSARVNDRIDLWMGDVTGNNTGGRWSVSGGISGGVSGYQSIVFPNSLTPEAQTSVSTPLSWDTTRNTTLQLSWYQTCCGSGTVVKWTASAKCVPMDGSGASDPAKFPAVPGDYNTVTSVSSNTVGTQASVGVALPLNTTGCNAGDMLRIFLERDNTVSSNMSGPARVLAIGLDISKRLQ
jgi:hypothetical protein